MALVGYCRVSSTGQSLEIQEAQLTEAGCEEIFSEKRSGTSTDGREQLDLALRFVRKGDILVVTRLDRLARQLGIARASVYRHLGNNAHEAQPPSSTPEAC